MLLVDGATLYVPMQPSQPLLQKELQLNVMMQLPGYRAAICSSSAAQYPHSFGRLCCLWLALSRAHYDASS